MRFGKIWVIFTYALEDYGICWDTLSDVSSDIQQKYFEIYEKEEKIREEE